MAGVEKMCIGDRYSELVRMCENGEIDFSRATTFNLDEYVGLPEGDPNSYLSLIHI